MMHQSIGNDNGGPASRRLGRRGALVFWLRRLLSPKVNSAAEIDQVISIVFSKRYPLVLTLAAFSLLLGLFRSALYGWHLMLAWHLPICLLLLCLFWGSQRISPSLIFRILLGILFADALHSLFTLGPAGTGMMSLAMLATLAGVFIGVRTGLAFLSLGTISACLIGAAFWTGMVSVRPHISGYLASPVAWLTPLTLTALLTVPLVLVVGNMHRKLKSSLDDLRQANALLRDEMSMRRQAEEEHHRSETRYRHIFDHASEGFFQSSPDGRLLAVNPALASMAGYSSCEDMLIGVNILGHPSWFNPADARWVGRNQAALESEEGLEFQTYTKDGRAIWVRMRVRHACDDHGRVLYYEGSAENITKRKTAEVALQESEANYRTVVENSLVASYIVQDGFFRFVNSRLCSILGYDREEIVGAMKLADVIHPDYWKVWQDHMSSTGVDRPENIELELKVMTRDRTPIAVKVLAASTTYNGRLAHFGTFVDVTREKTLESQLRQAQKMEAIGTLAGGIAHDFNNILTALTGYGTLLQMKLGDADPLRHYADQILSASQKAVNLTQSLLTFGRLQPVSLKPVDVNGIIRGTENLLRRLITEDITLSTRLSDEAIVVMADTTLIDQILFNLATNARDAMPDGGSLSIATSVVRIDKEFRSTHGFGKTGRYALMSVTDTGIGMDENTKERIFDPFFTTKEVGKGTGLGLSTVYGIVKQHRGFITVTSFPSEGTTFHIYLPTVKAHPDEAALVAPKDAGEGAETILVADDSPEVRHLLRDLLSQRGYTVVEAADGDEAIGRFMENERISLVVLDSVMPKKNGRQVYDAIRSARPRVKVLFMSGYARDVIFDKGIEEKDVDFMQKPLFPEELLEKVRTIITR